MKRKLFVSGTFGLLASLLFWFASPEKEFGVHVKLGDRLIYADVADTTKERQRGLMLTPYLAKDAGMFFIFEEEGHYPFWMLNTLIPLDIIWIGSDFTIVDIKKNAPSCFRNCESFKPEALARYVLEVKAGTADELSLKVGDRVLINPISE